MKDSFLLKNSYYTVCNALTWGNCRAHARAACEAASWSHRIVHSLVTFILIWPFVSQIISLFEMAIARCMQPVSADLTIKNDIRVLKRDTLHSETLCSVQVQEEPLAHRVRQQKEAAVPSTTTTLELPSLPEEPHEAGKLFYNAIFPLHRAIESAYRNLPWLSEAQHIVIRTKVTGGRGDIAAAAKVIDFLKKLSSQLFIDWVLSTNKYDPQPYLNDATNVQIRYECDGNSVAKPADMLIVGPAEDIGEIHSIENRIRRKIQGPLFIFAENAEMPGGVILKMEFEACKKAVQNGENYLSLHHTIFSSHQSYKKCHAYLPMGIKKGTGVFLNPELIGKPLSRDYCCPSYLLKISDTGLRMDILSAMNSKDQVQPDYDQFSFNSGYAHHPVSWAKCIDYFAIHEKNKHMVIVLNQKGEFRTLSINEFKDQIFTQQRLEFLKKQGYGTVILKDAEKIYVLQNENPTTMRRLVVIIRSSFKPADMRCMQLASERLLATGDNTAIEAWLARCILYLYEDVANGGCKDKFLQQQVDLAKEISPDLAELLTTFDGDRRQIEFPRNDLLNTEQMAKIQGLLEKPGLSDATLQLCDRIVEEYSFEIALEGALKRTMWMHKKPELVEIEEEELTSFGTRIIEYLKNPVSTTFSVDLANLMQRSLKECAL